MVTTLIEELTKRKGNDCAKTAKCKFNRKIKGLKITSQILLIAICSIIQLSDMYWVGIPAKFCSFPLLPSYLL